MTLGRWDLGDRRPPFEPLFARLSMRGHRAFGRILKAAFGSSFVILGKQFNAFFHSGILFIQIPIRCWLPSTSTASPSYVPARQRFVHTRQAPLAAFCLNKAHGLPPASCRGSRLPRRPLGEIGTGAPAVVQASKSLGNSHTQLSRRCGDLGPKVGVKGGNPGLDLQCSHPLAPSSIDHPAPGRPIIPNPLSNPARSILPIL